LARYEAICDELEARAHTRSLGARHLRRPPPYIEQALGARPESPRERGGWDQAVRAIERYRARHGINDRERALGPVPRDLPRRTAHRAAERELERAQQALGREHQLNLAREAGRHVRGL
jgi:hypothetical protein